MIERAVIEQDALWIRRRILELALKSGAAGAHVGGALSLVEILATLYRTISVSADENRDRVILSKGHGALALYATLERVGVMSHELVDTFETNGTHLYAHASRNIATGIEHTGGSLGLGISFATGVALACRSKGIDNNIYVIVGDGECDEGIVWEALMSIRHYNLSNVVVIVDYNGLQVDGNVAEVMNLDSLSQKFQSFGFATCEVDGHDVNELNEALSAKSDVPKAIIAHTVKGKGVSFMENVAGWHHGMLSAKKYDKALADLDERYGK